MSIDVIGPPAGVSTLMRPVQVAVNGATVKHNGPDIVYYGATPSVTTASYDGSLTSGASATLDGNQWFVVATGARAELASVIAAGGGSISVVDSNSNVVSSKVAAVILAADGTVDNLQVGTVSNGVFTPDAGQS